MKINKDELGAAVVAIKPPNVDKSKSPTPADKWGFAFVRSICSPLVPNGWARISPLKKGRKSRIEYLTESMIEEACNAALSQHNHFASKLFNEVEKLIESGKVEGTILETEYSKTKFYQTKKRKLLLENSTAISNKIEAYRQFQTLILTIVPDNVREADVPNVNVTDKEVKDEL